MGSLDNYQRVMARTMPIAVRLLRVQILANVADDATSAREVLDADEISVLRHKIEGTPLPKHPPSCKWAIQASAKLAGWQDSKRTGRIGLDTIWRGFKRLVMLVEGWRVAKAFTK